MARQHRHETLELGRGIFGRLVHIDQIADFGQGQTQTLAAQRQLQTRAIARTINPRTPARALATGTQQALILVETDRAWRDVEFPRQLSNGVSCHMDTNQILNRAIIDVYVNVK